MFKVAMLVWIILGATLAGCAMVAVLSIGSLASQAMQLIPQAVAAGFVLAMPLSYLVARKIGNPTPR
jgi:hypothetical protein